MPAKKDIWVYLCDLWAIYVDEMLEGIDVSGEAITRNNSICVNLRYLRAKWVGGSVPLCLCG